MKQYEITLGTFIDSQTTGNVQFHIYEAESLKDALFLARNLNGEILNIRRIK